MMDMKISSFVGNSCITSDDGQRVYKEIYAKLAAGEPVFLDFAGVRVFASPFFNFAIGQLLKDLKPDDLNKLLKVANITADGQLVWEQVVKNAKEYYKDPNAKKAIDEILKEQAEEE